MKHLNGRPDMGSALLLTSRMPACLCTVGDSRAIDFGETEDGFTLSFDAPAAGLYQFSATADASEFDWEELHVDLDERYDRLFLQSVPGQRTGPWDFNPIDGHKPLIPSYRVSINSRSIGLWFFQRVSLENLERREFLGRMAFAVDEPGPVELEFRPYRAMKLNWSSAKLEIDPEDALERFEPLTLREVEVPAASWADASFWQKSRESLATSRAQYREPLTRAFDWVMDRPEIFPDDILLLLAAHHLEDMTGALQKALELIDKYVAMPYWGNPKEDGYSHNGDMGAAAVLRSLAWAVHSLRADLGEERRARLLEKLTLQGNRFYELALLNRDYWGGSVLQGHGWKAMFAFGTAALHLLDIIPEARGWMAYLGPRLRRSLRAMPTDGAIPQTCYCYLSEYLDEPTHYREALLATTGEDIFQLYPFREIIDYCMAVTRPGEHLQLLTGNGGDLYPLAGGSAFFNRAAEIFGDGRAAWLSERILEMPITPAFEDMQHFGNLWGFVIGDSSGAPPQPEEPPRLSWFEDSGLIHFRDEETDVTLSVRCGPASGYNAYRNAPGPCDRLGVAIGPGHFMLALGGTPLLCTPHPGYKLHSNMFSSLLIDGVGHYGDVGYAFSIPALIHRGEQILQASWDEDSGQGMVRLDLAPAWPDSSGIVSYTRDFLLSNERRIICRDYLVLREERRLSWLFQGKRENGMKMEGPLSCRFGGSSGLCLEAFPTGVGLLTSIEETSIVWQPRKSAWSIKAQHIREVAEAALPSEFRLRYAVPFDRLRFDSSEPVTTCAVDFVLTW